MGFGYRAKYINQTAKTIVSLGGNEWINELIATDYHNAKENLLQLSGIGPKVYIYMKSIYYTEKKISIENDILRISGCRLYLSNVFGTPLCSTSRYSCFSNSK